MKLIKKLFGIKQPANSVKRNASEDNRPKDVPVNKSSWFLTHTESVAKEFDFLISEFGFKILKNAFSGHEYWSIYAKEHIEIEIWGDPGDLPFVFVRNTQLPYDESKNPDNRLNVDDYNPTAYKIRLNWQKRRAPIQKKFMDEWLNNDNLDLSELNNDYEKQGKAEHKAYLKEAGKTVREIIQKHFAKQSD